MLKKKLIDFVIFSSILSILLNSNAISADACSKFEIITESSYKEQEENNDVEVEKQQDTNVPTDLTENKQQDHSEPMESDEVHERTLDFYYAQQVSSETESQQIQENSLEDSDEFRNLCMITYVESGGETEIGQVAVAAVVLNRVRSDMYPNSIEEVIAQKGQFSAFRDGNFYIMTTPPKQIEYEDVPSITKRAVMRALAGEDPTEELLLQEAIRLGIENPEEYSSGGALGFYNPEKISQNSLNARSSIQVKVPIGNHTFYKIWG